jgi:hypothetical protein
LRDGNDYAKSDVKTLYRILWGIAALVAVSAIIYVAN